MNRHLTQGTIQGSGIASASRVSTFLQFSEHKEYLDELNTTQHCVKFQDASVCWSTKDEAPVLSNVNLNIDNNKLTVITVRVVLHGAVLFY